MGTARKTAIACAALLGPLLSLVPVAAGGPSPSRPTTWTQERVGSITLRSAGGRLPAVAVRELPRMAAVYDEHFGVTPRGLVIYFVDGPSRGGVRYDHFDHDLREIWLRWRPDHITSSVWTLAHELAHAYQFAFAPGPYRDDPSWIHEGWAEYAAGLYFERLAPGAFGPYRRLQARLYIEKTADWEAIFTDVYDFGWREAYPCCYLAVRVLVEQHGGVPRLKRYFRQHGIGPPEQALQRVYGLGVPELGTAIEAAAQESRLKK